MLFWGGRASEVCRAAEVHMEQTILNEEVGDRGMTCAGGTTEIQRAITTERILCVPRR